MGAKYLKSLGCSDDIQCLQRASVDDIIKAEVVIDKTIQYFRLLQTFYPWTPILDGIEFSEQPLTAFQHGRFQQMPIIMGSVSNETLLFIYEAAKKPINDFEYIGVVEAIFGIQGYSVLQEYKSSLSYFSDYRHHVAHLGDDYIFLCTLRNVSINASKRVPVYLYHFDHIISFSKQFWPNNYAECVDAVCHAEELPFVFGTPTLDNYHFDSNEIKLSNLMIYYWTNFAISGDPNFPNRQNLNWSPYSNSRSNLRFMTPSSVIETGWRESKCNFFDNKIGYHHGW